MISALCASVVLCAGVQDIRSPQNVLNAYPSRIQDASFLPESVLVGCINRNRNAVEFFGNSFHNGYLQNQIVSVFFVSHKNGVPKWFGKVDRRVSGVCRRRPSARNVEPDVIGGCLTTVFQDNLYFNVVATGAPYCGSAQVQISPILEDGSLLKKVNRPNCFVRNLSCFVQGSPEKVNSVSTYASCKKPQNSHSPLCKRILRRNKTLGDGPTPIETAIFLGAFFGAGIALFLVGFAIYWIAGFRRQDEDQQKR